MQKRTSWPAGRSVGRSGVPLESILLHHLLLAAGEEGVKFALLCFALLCLWSHVRLFVRRCRVFAHTPFLLHMIYIAHFEEEEEEEDQ